MKKYRVQYNIGKSKYVVSYSNGAEQHDDGSIFFDVKIFSNKKLLNKFIETLSSQGYIEVQ
jgi:hypothetical protein